MKKKFTILITAALMLLTTMARPITAWGQAPVNTVLWSEDFSGYSNSAVPSGEITDSHTGTTVYGGVTLTYACANGGSNTQVYTTGGPNNNNNLLISKGNGSFSISGISTGDATELTITYAKSGSGVISISVSPSTATISNSNSGATITTNGASTIDLTFKNSNGSNNLRFDDASLTVKTAGSGGGSDPTITLSDSGTGNIGNHAVNTEITRDFTVTQSNLTSPISLSATNGGTFTINDESATSIPASDGSTVVTWHFTPTAAGQFTSTITATSGETSATCTYMGYAYEVHNVNIANMEHGTVTANPTSTFYWELVSLTVTPDNGYELEELTVVDANNSPVAVTNNSFHMPDSDVTVSATFVQASPTTTVTDVLNYDFTGISGSSYQSWSDKTGLSGAVYAGNSNAGVNYIQLRSTSPSGIVSTTSAGKVKKVTVTWNSGTADNRTLNVYGSNTAYEGSSDLYGSNAGNLLGTIVKGTSTELTVTGDYAYVGLRSASGAMYIDKIEIDWATSGTPTCAAPTFTPAAGTYYETQNVTIASAAEGATIYYTLDESTPSATNGTQYTAAIEVSANTTIKAIAVKEGYNDSQVSTAIYTITLPPVATPTFTPAAGTYTETQNVTIACTTEGATIYYTIDGTDPTTESSVFSQALSISQTTTVKAMAVKSGMTNSEIATAVYTIEEALNTMQAIFDRATEVGNTATDVNIAFQNWVVSGVSTNGKNVFVTDGTKGFVIFNNGGNMGFAVGNILSGTVSCKVQLYNGFAEITQLNASTTGISIATGGTVTAANIPMADLSGVNTSALVHYDNLTCSVNNSKYYLTDGTTTLQVFNSLYAFGSLVEGKIYNITGVYQQYNTNSGDTKEILPRSADDIEEVVSTEPSITVADATVNVGAEGDEGTLTVTYENITEVVAEVWFCDAAGENDASYDWITADINEGNNVGYLVEPNEGEERTAYFKVWAYDDEMSEVYSNLVTVTQAEYIAPSYAELPFSFNGGKADIENTDGLSQEGLGSDYNSAPKLKFDNTGDWLLLQFNERPGTLTFDIKGNSFSDGTFKVQTSENGITYTDLATYTELGETQNETFPNLGENVRYIKWIYTEKVTGNVGLGNITLAEYAAPVPAITLNSYSIEATAEETEGSLTVTLNNITITELEQLGVDFCDENGTLLTGTNTQPSWFEYEFALVNEEYKLNYTIAANAETTERVAYFKVYDIDSEVYSDKVTVTQEAYVAPVASVILDEYEINAPADGTDGNLAITLDNIDITEEGDGAFDMIFCDSEGTPLPDPSEKPEWFDFDFPYENDAWSVYYLIGENETTEERTAYFKVYGVGDNGSTEAYSELVTVTQAGATGPVTTGTITFGSAEGSIAITTASLNGQSATDNMDNTWTITTVFSGETSFTQNAAYSQVGASSKPATSITFTTTLAQATTITAFEAKFGGFSGTAGDINLLVGETNVGSGALNASTDVTVTNTTTATGTTLTVTVTNIAKGVKCYYISYTVSTSTDPMINAPASIDLASDATSGEIEYSILNPATGVNLTATTTTSWISGITVTDEKVSFTTSANTETTERQGTITLSYAGATDKEVTVIQAAYVPPVEEPQFALFGGDLVEGDYIIYYNGKAMNNVVSGSRLQYAEIEPEDNVITTDNAAIVWHIALNDDGYWTIYNADANKYAASTGTKNQAQMLADGTDDKAMWTVTEVSDTYYEFVNKANAASGINANLRNNGTYGFACYATGTGGALSLYKYTETVDTYTKEIAGYGTSEGGYYLIASPVLAVTPSVDNDFLTDAYDLYYFDQNEEQEWRNYEAKHFNLAAGKGYLYASQENTTLTFTGAPYSGNGEVTLSYDDSAEFAGWNLIGNPFDTNATISEAYYTLNTEGTELIAGESSTIGVMEGIFVYADDVDQSVTFTPQGKGTRGENEMNSRVVLNLSGSNTVLDRAIVRFGEGRTLPKFMLNPENTKLYIPQNGNNYAVVNAQAFGEMPVNFKTVENGTYTIDFSMDNVEFNYLHLIDNMTGADIDLLVSPSYTFHAKRTDYASRFRLVFCTNANDDTTGEQFAFISNGNIIISDTENATIQVVDMLGRIVTSRRDGSHTLSTADMTPGVYVIRLIQGENVRNQKIVVK